MRLKFFMAMFLLLTFLTGCGNENSQEKIEKVGMLTKLTTTRKILIRRTA